MSLIPSTLSLFVAALVLTGCYEPRAPLAGLQPDCASGCHGTSVSIAPPPGLWISGGKTATTDRGVGAHQSHLAAGVACDACHRVPASVDAPGHMDTPLPAEVQFGDLARTGGVAAIWDGSACQVYCHAGNGGSVPRPIWTRVDGTQGACGACHGLPPGGKHTQSTGCHLCHGQVVDAQMKIIDPTLHIDGKVQSSGKSGCSACHGSNANSAPPVDTSGNSAPSARGVGAHQAHVRAGPRHAALPCSECHQTPTTVDAPGHMDTPLPAEVQFGTLATTGGATPAWDTTKLACATTYCHGSLEGGGNPAPSWTAGQPMVCGSCHGLPPSKSRSGTVHPAANLSECVTCHPAVVDKSGSITNPARHVNGTVDFN